MVAFFLFVLYNKSLNDWSLGKQFILFPENLYVSPRRSRGKHWDSQSLPYSWHAGLTFSSSKWRKTKKGTPWDDFLATCHELYKIDIHFVETLLHLPHQFEIHPIDQTWSEINFKKLWTIHELLVLTEVIHKQAGKQTFISDWCMTSRWCWAVWG